uniref:Uncharacterized protein n=1 Tax=Arundo donax TaxID=35708 RepID=A0A0A9BZR6_ARUDO
MDSKSFSLLSILI